MWWECVVGVWWECDGSVWWECLGVCGGSVMGMCQCSHRTVSPKGTLWRVGQVYLLTFDLTHS